MFRILTIVLLLLIAGCDSKSQKEENNTKIDEPTITKKQVLENSVSNSSSEAKKEILSFTLNTIDGKTLNITEIDNGLRFEEFKDKAIFVIFFGYRCPPCVKEMPILIELTKKYKDLEIVAIEVQGYDNEELKAYGKRKGINYNLISSDEHMDFISYIQQKANWHGSIPFLLGLNSKGIVSIVHTGGIGKDALEGAYKDLINIK